MSNTGIWDALARTDPKHTKAFKRAGGFSGTAIKPIWITRKLTEQFGPAGIGWGVGEPTFQVVPGNNGEVLVYCTVSAWHGTATNVLWGVGGDKVVSYVKANEQYKRPERWENDDEAFKKAFTDAVGNAFKSIGVGADVHMGLFDDDKYVTAAKAEFAEPAPVEPAPHVEVISDEQWSILASLIPEAKLDVKLICDSYKISSIKALPASKYQKLRERIDGIIRENGKVAA